MNIFNKIVVMLILIFLIGFSIVSMVNVFAGYFEWSSLAAQIFNPANSINAFVAFLALVAVFAISVFLLILEFYRKKTRVANISSSKTGNAMVTIETVAGQIKNEVTKIDGVEDVRVKIVPKPTGIIIDMNARLSDDSDIPDKMQEIINRASGIVSDKLGIKVVKTNLTIIGLVSGGEGGKSKKKNTKEKAAEAVPAEVEDIIETEDDDE
ncbi:MAG: alkaline shock response membrane anchor protein AmaP [Actinomycetota bacterium]|nr:alkaline shock response membrane anchor protein AmaP [Actinomycetota bacterium]